MLQEFIVEVPSVSGVSRHESLPFVVDSDGNFLHILVLRSDENDTEKIERGKQLGDCCVKGKEGLRTWLTNVKKNYIVAGRDVMVV